MAGGSPGLPTAKLTHRASVTIILYPFTLFHNVNNLLGNAWHLLIEDDSISSSKLCTYWVYPYLNFSYVCDLLIYTACVWMPTCTHTPSSLAAFFFFFIRITCFDSSSNSYSVGSYYWQILPAWDGVFSECSLSTAVWDVWTLLC